MYLSVPQSMVGTNLKINLYEPTALFRQRLLGTEQAVIWKSFLKF
jgi:hypothetical protein